MQILTQKAAAQEIEEARFGLLSYAAQLPLDLVTCFTGTKVQILAPRKCSSARDGGCSGWAADLSSY